MSNDNVILSDLTVLNVGGYSKNIPIADCFTGWGHDLLDIDPALNPDILCDARELWRLPPRKYDAIYCSHNLEHYYYHDLSKVLKGFRTVLKKNGFAYIEVPDLLSAMKAVVEKGMDIEDVLYESQMGPILVRDVIYGSHIVIENCENDFMLHKHGFTETSLSRTLLKNGFTYVYTGVAGLATINAIAFIEKPSKWHIDLLHLNI